MTRAEIFRKAAECVCNDRDKQYGSPENNFGMISDLWTLYLGHEVSSVDVAMMMVLLKIARVKNGTMTEDSFVDICGYGACGGELAEIEKEKFSESMNKLSEFLNEC